MSCGEMVSENGREVVLESFGDFAKVTENISLLAGPGADLCAGEASRLAQLLYLRQRIEQGLYRVSSEQVAQSMLLHARATGSVLPG